MRLDLYAFAEAPRAISPQRRLRDLLEQIDLAEQVGLDVFGVGEHHRPDFAVSRPRPCSAPPPRARSASGS
jgi:alkanesulfonate monooxygenase SsuD/methylene tetrahydromethanopterin reductase-like flavin-dependent oxidoreductase (luciferase family)